MKGGHRMKGIGALVLGLLLVGAAGSANAQARGYVGIGGGVSLPMGDFGDGSKMGFLAQVNGGVNFGETMFGVRVNGTYAQHKEKDPGTHTLKLLGVTGDVVLTPKTEGKASPYILAGAGMVNSKVESASSTDLAWNAGAGVKFNAGSVGVFVEARFMQVRGDGSSSSMIPITAGVRIGGN